MGSQLIDNTNVVDARFKFPPTDSLVVFYNKIYDLRREIIEEPLEDDHEDEFILDICEQDLADVMDELIVRKTRFRILTNGHLEYPVTGPSGIFFDIT